MLHRLRRQAKGFTLIELLIVVAIIGILAAIAIPNLVSAQKRAKMSRALADTRQMVSQSELYNNDKNKYPALLTDLMGGKYMATVYDPFGATSTTDYGYGNPTLTAGDPVWAMSVGPAKVSATKQTKTESGTACDGAVGYQNDIGAVQPSGC